MLQVVATGEYYGPIATTGAYYAENGDFRVCESQKLIFLLVAPPPHPSPPPSPILEASFTLVSPDNPVTPLTPINPVTPVIMSKGRKIFSSGDGLKWPKNWSVPFLAP